MKMKIIPLQGFTYFYLVYNLFQFREKDFYRSFLGVNLGEERPQKCLCTFLGNNRHDSNFPGRKFLISTYLEYRLVNTICSCLIYTKKSLVLESFQLSKYQKNPHSGIKMNHFIILKLKFTRILTLRNEIKYQHFKVYLEKINNVLTDYLYYNIYKILLISYFHFFKYMICPILITWFIC